MDAESLDDLELDSSNQNLEQTETSGAEKGSQDEVENQLEVKPTGVKTKMSTKAEEKGITIS